MASERKVTARLLLAANLAAANAAAIVCVMTFFDPGFVGVYDAERGIVHLSLGTGSAWLVFLGATLLVVCNFAWLVRRKERPQPRNYVISETPGGPVRVSREALEAGLRQAGEALPEITRLRVQVDASVPKRITVFGQFQCAEGTSNLAASQRLRHALAERFAELVRPEGGVRVEFELEFQGFAGRLAKKGEPLPEPEPPPFTGPKYPIDDDESGGH